MISKRFNIPSILINTHIWKRVIFEKEIDEIPSYSIPPTQKKDAYEKDSTYSPNVHCRCLKIYYFLPLAQHLLLELLANI